MSAGKTTGHSGLPRNADIAQIVEHINRVKSGQINCVFQNFTLNTNSTSTVFTDSRVFATSYIDLSPTNSTAAKEWVSGNLYPSNQIKGSVVINHSSGSTASRTFNILIIG